MNEEQMKERIELTERQLRQAMKDYVRYVDNDYNKEMVTNMTDRFYKRLAKDSVIAKSGLRDFFELSDHYNAELDAIVIEADKNKQPDIKEIGELTFHILRKAISDKTISVSLAQLIAEFNRYTNTDYVNENPNSFELNKTEIIKNFPELYKNDRYDPNRKRSRVFKAICDRLKITDNSKGSEFQTKFAQLADQMNAKKIPFRLYISINPCHFLTMSNPKYDRRGTMLTSCHSLNSRDYSYNNGCIGYARDSVTMIVFTVDDNNFTTDLLNNRKTSRQLYMYMPHNNILLQSRLYNTQGGTSGEQETSKLYRDIIEQEFSKMENIPNLWIPKSATDESVRNWVRPHRNYGGYCDWEYNEFGAKLLIHKNADRGKIKEMIVGAAGLCINCASENSDGLYCEDCDFDEDEFHCDCCGEWCNGTRYTAYDNGEQVTICEDCRYNDFEECRGCHRVVRYDELMETHNGEHICRRCFNESYRECDECGDIWNTNEFVEAYNKNGYEIEICPNCARYYIRCAECGKLHHPKALHYVMKDGEERRVCETCLHDYYETNAVTEKWQRMNEMCKVKTPTGYAWFDAQEKGDTFTVCQNCGEYITYDLAYMVENQTYCNRCKKNYDEARTKLTEKTEETDNA